jgi:hypothetical protein
VTFGIGHQKSVNILRQKSVLLVHTLAGFSLVLWHLKGWQNARQCMAEVSVLRWLDERGSSTASSTMLILGCPLIIIDSAAEKLLAGEVEAGTSQWRDLLFGGMRYKP